MAKPNLGECLCLLILEIILVPILIFIIAELSGVTMPLTCSWACDFWEVLIGLPCMQCEYIVYIFSKYIIPAILIIFLFMILYGIIRCFILVARGECNGNGTDEPDCIDQDHFQSRLEEFLSNVNLTHEAYKANEEYWEEDPYGKWKLKSDVDDYSNVIDDMIENKNLYRFDCTNIAYFAQLYALKESYRHSLGSGSVCYFNNNFKFEHMTFDQDNHDKDNFLKESFGSAENSPIGSRIALNAVGTITKKFSNSNAVEEPHLISLIPSAWQGENVIKVGDNSYYAQGLTELEEFEYGTLSYEETEYAYAQKLLTFLDIPIVEGYYVFENVYVETVFTTETITLPLDDYFREENITDEGVKQAYREALTNHLLSNNIDIGEIYGPKIDFCR